MSLARRLGLSTAPPPQAAIARVFTDAKPGGVEVHWSADLGRIMDLPRRDLPTAYSRADVEALEARLRAPAAPCKCAESGRPCPTNLQLVQAQALLEAPKAGGLVGAIGVGHGKTLIDLLLPFVMGSKVAVLLIPSNLRAQLLERDWPFYGAHWNLPNLAGGQWFKAGRPVLHVVTYNKLSGQDSSDLLSRINPDLVICDEAHNLRDRKAARTLRFLRYFAQHKGTRLCALSGTLTAKSIKDAAHLAELALGDGSPYPHHFPTLEEWALALDVSDTPAGAGQLGKLCAPGEHVREGFARRRNDTLGVVSSDAASQIDTPIQIRERRVPLPPGLAGAMELAEKGERPDGEQLVEQLEIASCVRQLSSGFFHRWRFPRMEPEALILDWFKKRQAWNRELREKLSHPREHLDSPGLLMKAAIRAHMDPPYDGERPKWKAHTWEAWAEIHDQVKPVPQAVWLSEFLVNDAAAWAREKPGIVWVEFPELGEKVARAAGVPYYGGGEEASATIGGETGKRSIVASIKAHGTGKNLTAFSRNLVVNPPSDGAAWEQLIGRTHRQPQAAEVVTVEVYTHTDATAKAFEKARELSLFLQQTERLPKKLCFAEFPDE